VITGLRNIEIENRVYKMLETLNYLHPMYDELVHELEEAVVARNIKSFSLFGHLCKYKPQSAARTF
jgi:hypothetical protein